MLFGGKAPTVQWLSDGEPARQELGGFGEKANSVHRRTAGELHDQ